ncbi:MAG: hypothetical protein LBO69_01485 [Ignavibacteria bacterium]|jgi:iron-sulfur cluster assembly protein|nr:hypothetical protein [Ignavibacteria bacterium]
MNIIFRNLDGYEVIAPNVAGADVSEDIVFTVRAMTQLLQELEDAHPFDEDDMESKPFFIRLFMTSNQMQAKKFAIQFDNIISEDDRIYELRKIKVIIDRKSIFYFMGVLIDYINTDTSSGYVFIEINDDNLEKLDINNNTNADKTTENE